ncbi:MAG: polysaccharide biosynthesis/export family protein [Flavobacteriales bacterium]|nr:polysaccharide biosynthesis/export family protein [Flavobacteriales bacterium]
MNRASHIPGSQQQWSFSGWPFFALLMGVVFLAGCTINRDIMFKTGVDYDFMDLEDIASPGYRIAPNDLLTFQLYSNNGQRLLAITAGSTDSKGGNNMQQMQQNNQLTYLVRPDGILELPEIGTVRLEGLTLDEAESLLEEAYSSYYNFPYAVLRVTNNRVLLFPGDSGKAQVITLENMNTTLLEVLALAGGIGSRGNASKVKLIRKTDAGNDVYLMDLSTIDGLESARLVVQANDIVYVEPLPQLVREATESLSPIATLISTLTLLYAFIISPN